MSVHSGFDARRVVIVGADSLGRVVADILLTSGANARLVPLGFVDREASRTGEVILGLPVFGTLNQLAAIPHEAVVVATAENTAREQITRELESRGEQFVTVRHPFSSIAHGVQIGTGSVVSAGVVIGPSTRIGRGVVLGAHACVEGETIVDDFAHLECRVVVGTGAHVGARVLLELGASVAGGRRIDDGCVAGPCVLVDRDLVVSSGE